MNIDLSTLSGSGVYHLMTQTIIPRPIAWVLSENADASVNLAPFSYFNAVCSDPPLCMLSMGRKPDESLKDTVTNLTVGAHCVVHIAHVDQSDLVTATAATLDYQHSEVEANNIALTAHNNWPLQRISDCPIAYLCRVHSTTTIGNNDQNIVFVEALELYLDDKTTIQQKGRIQVDALAVNPLARLGASQYANLGSVFKKARPE